MEIVHVADQDEKRSLRVAYNAIFRRVFGYRTRESVTDLQVELGRLTWEELVDQRIRKFYDRTCLGRPDTLVLAVPLISVQQ